MTHNLYKINGNKENIYRVFANKMDYAILPKSRGFAVNRMVKT